MKGLVGDNQHFEIHPIKLGLISTFQIELQTIIDSFSEILLHCIFKKQHF